jgi:hypothetical protein
MQQAATKKITHFIEAQSDGTFDQVIWYKNKAGEKVSTREKINPTTEQVKNILLAPYQTIFLN